MLNLYALEWKYFIRFKSTMKSEVTKIKSESWIYPNQN